MIRNMEMVCCRVLYPLVQIRVYFLFDRCLDDKKRLKAEWSREFMQTDGDLHTQVFIYFFNVVAFLTCFILVILPMFWRVP